MTSSKQNTKEKIEMTAQEAPNDNVTISRAELTSMMKEAAAEAVSMAQLADDRLSHDQEMHGEVHEEYQDQWEEPMLLDFSKYYDKPGFAIRLTRTTVEGVSDELNIARAYNKGWRPVQQESLAKGIEAPNLTFRGHAGVVGIHGLILMERPLEICKREAAASRKRAKAQQQAVDYEMKHDSLNGRGGNSAPTIAERTSTRSRTPNVPD
jgi:hypothetical protein